MAGSTGATSMTHPRFLLASTLFAILLLSGCAPGPPDSGPAADLPLTTRLRCGDQEIAAGFEGQAMRLRVGDETFDLRGVVSASGAKYEAVGDPATTYWSKGSNATLVVRGRSYPECVPVEGAARAFRARGNEPPWTLEIAAERITLVTDYGQKRLEAPTPAAETLPGVTRYAAGSGDASIAITISDRVCGDSMSGMPYPQSVELVADGRTLAGCGGEPVALLAGAEWTVESLGGAGLVEGSSATLAFGGDGRVSGKASCNGFTGEYSLTGEGLSIGKLATTRMACPPPLMEQEAAFLAALGAVQRFEITPEGKLALLAVDGKGIVARR